MSRPVHEAWQRFSIAKIPADAPPIVFRELRAAFFCGAYALFDVVTTEAEQTGGEFRGQERMVQAIADRLADFRRGDVIKGPESQLRAMSVAFLCGADALRDTLFARLAPTAPDVVTDGDERLMLAVESELRNFVTEVQS